MLLSSVGGGDGASPPCGRGADVQPVASLRRWRRRNAAASDELELLRVEGLSSPESFSELYPVLGPKLLSFFVRRTRNAEVSLDLTAETFAKAFERRDDFVGREPKEILGWFWKTAEREISRYRRSGSVEMRAFSRLGMERELPSERELREIELRAAWEEIRAVLEQGMNRLPTGQREVLRRRFVQEHDYQQIAEDLQISYAAVRQRASRGLRALGANPTLAKLVEELE